VGETEDALTEIFAEMPGVERAGRRDIEAFRRTGDDGIQVR